VINSSKLAHAHLLVGWYSVFGSRNTQRLTLAQRLYWRLPIYWSSLMRVHAQMYTTHTRGRINIAINRFHWLLHFLLKNSRTILCTAGAGRSFLFLRSAERAAKLHRFKRGYRDHCKITFDARERNYNSALLQHYLTDESATKDDTHQKIIKW
jgi:hypothetical protein